MSNNIWLHRISHQGQTASPMLEKENHITIGWNGCQAPEVMATFQHTDWRPFDKVMREKGVTSRNRWSLWYFAAGMKPGDWVVVPRPYEFRVYKITGGLEPLIGDEYQKLDLGFKRKVEPLTRWLGRAEYADAALTRRMKWMGTTIGISDLLKSVELAIGQSAKNQPLSLYANLRDATLPEWQKCFQKFVSANQLEKLVEWYLKRAGADEVEIPARNERNKAGDCDVEACFESIKTIVSVQVKNHEGQTGVVSVEQIADYADKADQSEDDADYMRVRWVVSTAEDFTPEARALAKERGVLLFNGDDFTRLLLAAGIDASIDKIK